MSGRPPPLAEKALSEAYGRLRYRDTSLLIWQQQQQHLASLPPRTYLSRSRSAWYSQYGNQAILQQQQRGSPAEAAPEAAAAARDTGRSKVCALM
ncbi:hypothetical protein JRQ81_008729 [Phrynocephalus forsythii]|uniref:Uncharacterized protein n=1 Tax=Phrynocephalus forsythii TaxID=171643 RepID=A0A9Q1ASY3_9SAUR|nr:hypothetical protein JRQ81_008729 [Phrynocephalus forsythii]